MAYPEPTPVLQTILEPSVPLAQQAVEKAPNALLLARGVPFSRAHSPTLRLALTIQAGGQIPPGVPQAEVVGRYTLRGRCPLGFPEVTQGGWEEALALARGGVRWVESRLHG